jgi:hypothetical protein
MDSLTPFFERFDVCHAVKWESLNAEVHTFFLIDSRENTEIELSGRMSPVAGHSVCVWPSSEIK